MFTTANVAVRAPRELALETLAEALCARESQPPVASDDLFAMIDALDAWMERLILERVDAWPLGVVVQGPWTLLYDPQGVLPMDAEVLGTISARLGTRVVGVLVETNSDTNGLVVFRDGTLERKLLAVGDEIKDDVGSLGDDDDLSSNPSHVEEIWDALVPSDVDVEKPEVRVFSPSV